MYAKTSAAGFRVQDAAFVLKWRLSSLSTSSASGETGTYPVGQTKCLSVASVPGAADGVALAPVVQAILGKEIKASETVLFDSINASQISYVCKGTTLDFACSQAPPPPTAGNVTKEIGEFMLGFTEGLGMQIGFTDCIQDVNKTVSDIEAIVDFFQSGINFRSPTAIARAFELLGGLLKDIAAAITVCVKDVAAFVAKMQSLAAALSGNLASVVKVLVDEAVHIWHDRTEITDDCKMCATSWRAGDFQTAGKSVGDLVGVILNGLDFLTVLEILG